MTMSDADDHLAHEVRHEFSAKDVAEHDQAMSTARTAVSGLLSAYMTFHYAMEKGELETANFYHARFTEIFRTLSREIAFMGIVALCDWISMLLKEKYDGWGGLATAVRDGTFLRGNDGTRSPELALFQDLEEQFKEGS